MLQNLIVSYSSRRGVCKLVAVLAGAGVLGLAVVGKVTSTGSLWWVAAPLGLLWLVDTGYGAEQRRCAAALKKNPAKDYPAVALWEGGDTGIFRFFGELLSLSIWPFYLILFLVIGFGGKEIARANKEAAEAAEAAQKAAIAAAAPLAPRYPQSSVPLLPNRSNNNPMSLNPGMPRFTPAPFPAPFPTPPRFPTPARPFPTPPKLSMTPAAAPAASPNSAPGATPASSPATAPKNP